MLHTFTDNRPLHSNTSDYFQIRASHDLPQYNVKEGDLGGYVQKYKESDTHVTNLTADSWVAQGCYVDKQSLLSKSLVEDDSHIFEADIYCSTITKSVVRESLVQDSNITSAYLEKRCEIDHSTVSETCLLGVHAFQSILTLDDPASRIFNASVSDARITKPEQVTSLTAIGTERRTASLYPHKDTGKPTVRIGCWHGDLKDLPKEVNRRLVDYVLDGNPQEQADIYSKEYLAFETYAKAYAEMFIND